MSKNKLAAAKHKLALERNAQALRCLAMRKRYPRPTLKEIGEAEGVSGEWVRQILIKAGEL